MCSSLLLTLFVALSWGHFVYVSCAQGRPIHSLGQIMCLGVFSLFFHPSLSNCPPLRSPSSYVCAYCAVDAIFAWDGHLHNSETSYELESELGSLQFKYLMRRKMQKEENVVICNISSLQKYFVTKGRSDILEHLNRQGTKLSNNLDQSAQLGLVRKIGRQKGVEMMRRSRWHLPPPAVQF